MQDQNTTTNANQNHSAPRLLTEGVFKAKPVKGVLMESKNGNLQYGVQFLLLEGPDSGKHISWWGGFKGEGFKYTTGTLGILGWDKKAPLETWQPTNQVMLVLVRDTIPAVAPSPSNPNGKPAQPTTRVKYVNSLDGSGAGNGLEKLALKGDKLKSASATIMARLAAGEGGDDAGADSSSNTGGDANAFDPNVGGGNASGDDDLPF